MPSSTRRRLLASVLGGATAGLAGCFGSDGGIDFGDGEEIDEAPSRETPEYDGEFEVSGDWPMAGGAPDRSGAVATEAVSDGSIVYSAAGGLAHRRRPVVADGQVILSGETVRAHSLKDGTAEWSFASDGVRRFRTPAIDGDTVVVGGQGRLYGLNLDSGETRWQTALLAGVSGGVAVRDGIAYVSDGARGSVEVFDITDGERLFFSNRDDSATEPAVIDDRIVMGVESLPRIRCLDAANGDQIWARRIPELVAAPVCRNDRVYVVADGTLLIFALADGETLAEIDLGEMRTARHQPLAVDDERVYVGGPDEYLRVFSVDGDRLEWRFRTWNHIRTTPVVADGVVYVASTDRGLYALDTETGDRRWDRTVGRRLQGLAALDGGVLAASRGRLYTLGGDGR